MLAWISSVVIYACTTLGLFGFFPRVFLSFRVTGACPVITDLIMRVNVRTTTCAILYFYYKIPSIRILYMLRFLSHGGEGTDLRALFLHNEQHDASLATDRRSRFWLLKWEARTFISEWVRCGHHYRMLASLSYKIWCRGVPGMGGRCRCSTDCLQIVLLFLFTAVEAPKSHRQTY